MYCGDHLSEIDFILLTRGTNQRIGFVLMPEEMCINEAILICWLECNDDAIVHLTFRCPLLNRSASGSDSDEDVGVITVTFYQLITEPGSGAPTSAAYANERFLWVEYSSFSKTLYTPSFDWCRTLPNFAELGWPIASATISFFPFSSESGSRNQLDFW